MKYRHDIDGLRAIAVLMVLVFHFDLAWKGKAGFVGVDVFYVISGFLITTIIKKQLDDNSFDLRAFYISRIRRLAPAFFAVLVMVMAAGAFLLFPDDLYELSKQALASQTYIANFYYWRNINYFGLNADNVLLLHTWSLAVEEQFYLVYPLFLLLTFRYLRRYFWGALFVVLAASFILNLAFVKGYPEATFYLLPTRAWELLLGGITPLIHEKFHRSRQTNELIGIAGFSLILSAMLLYNEQIRVPGTFALLPTFGAVCLILSGTSNTTTTSWLLGLHPIVYIGKISYSLYLVHWPINVYAKNLLEDDYTLPWRLGMFALSFVVSAIIYHAIENPFRRRKLFTTDRKLITGYVSGLCVTVFAFLAVKSSDGLPARFPDEVVRIMSYANDKTPTLTKCEFKDKTTLRNSDFCTIGTPGKEPDWLIYGDSHAWAGHDAFDKFLKLKGSAGLFMFRHACPPVNGIHLFKDKGKCLDFNKEISNFLDNNKKNKKRLLGFHVAPSD